MVRRVLLATICALALTGCGKQDYAKVVVIRPAHPLYDCLSLNYKSKPCHSFDLRRLLGLTLQNAEGLARRHGFRLEVIGQYLSRDAVTGRVRVTTEHGIVVNIYSFE
jgi:hypothetical protein